jgi:hypothetical protein
MPRTSLVLFVAGMLAGCTTEVVTWESPTDPGGQEEGPEEEPRGPDDPDATGSDDAEPSPSAADDEDEDDQKDDKGKGEGDKGDRKNDKHRGRGHDT